MPSFVLLLFRFDGDELTTDERIRTLAQRWQPSRSLRLDEQSAKAVDTDMIILPCLVRGPPHRPLPLGRRVSTCPRHTPQW